MDDDLFINSTLTIPSAELHTRTSRSSGPGGQHANKTSSRVTLEWNPLESETLSALQRLRIRKNLAHRINSQGVISLSCDDSRSQHQNREIARERLAKLVEKALLAPKKRIATQPSRAAKARRLDEKKQNSSKKRMRSRSNLDD